MAQSQRKVANVRFAMSVCLSSCNNSITLNGLSLNLLLGSFTEICGHIPVLVKKEQRTLHVKAYRQIEVLQAEAVDKNEANI
jgi:hypothetical protein